MSALPYKLVPYVVLLATAIGLFVQPARAAVRACVKSEATEREARRVQAAAHDAGADSHGALEIRYFCQDPTTAASATLRTPLSLSAEGATEFWVTNCDREARRWFRRAEWSCGAPIFWTHAEIHVPLAGADHVVSIGFDSPTTYAIAIGLTRRALALYDAPESSLPHCGPSVGKQLPANNWNELRKSFRDYATAPESSVIVEVEQDVYRIWLFNYAGISVDFRREDTADPANAPGCWGSWLFID